MKVKHLKVLLIEDNQDHAQLLIRSFKRLISSCSITHIEDGEAALNYLREQERNELPHLILLDLRLPKVDGLEVLRFIKNENLLSELPVIILTTSDAETDIAKAYKCHANSYLVKPTDFNKFTELINSMGNYWFNWNQQPIIG